MSATSRRWARRLALAAAGVALMLAAVLGVTWLQRSILFPRRMVPQDPSALSTPGLERWWLDSDDGRVETWFLPGDGVSVDAPGPAVVFTHGNGELIDHWPRVLGRYRELGVSVVLPEYRGYGRSAGAPSERAIAEDLARLADRLRGEPRVDRERIVYHGRSLGGGAAATLLDAHPPRALVLESTFTSVPDVVPQIPSFLLVDRFESLPRILRYDGPVIVFHGVRDQVVPVEHGRRIAEAHPRARLITYDCGHNDLPPRGADYWSHIERFLERAEVLP